MKNTSIQFLILGISIFWGCKNTTESKAENSSESAESTTSIFTLFDGTNTEGWRVFNGTDFPGNWSMEEGVLKCSGTAAEVEGGGDLIYAAKQFDNFELSLEWKISAGGNSGIFYHVVEGKEYHAPYQTGPEYQVLHDNAFPDLSNLHLTGADYAMYSADPSKKTTKPAGEWNTSKIVFTKTQVQHWLNGSKIVEFVPWSEHWKSRKEGSKWKSEANYGAANTGFIGLQDHGHEVWYRNIKVMEL